MTSISDEDLIARYPTSLLRGTRIARLDEQYIGPAASNARTCRILGEDQIGWFIGGMPTYDRMIELVRRIEDANVGGRWFVVPATRFLAEVAYQIWTDGPHLPSQEASSTMWHGKRVTFCVPERLDEIPTNNRNEVAGIILLDPNCIVYRGRGFGSGKTRVAHDRPQLIVDFRSRLAVGRWSPPFMIMSIRKAAAVATDTVSRIYGLDAVQFIEGSSLRCGEIGFSVNQNSSDISGHMPNVLVS